MSEGTEGRKIFNRAARNACKVTAAQVKSTFPRKTGKAVSSVKVRALKRKRGRIGARVSLFAQTAKGFPYPLAIEHGAKVQPRSGRVRNSGKTKAAYASLTWRIEPRLIVQHAFDDTVSTAQGVMIRSIVEDWEKLRPS
jgi:hypothetical protein